MDDEKADELIILVAEYVELYDLQNKNYSNQQRKENIWREIALKLKETRKYLLFVIFNLFFQITEKLWLHLLR